MGAEKGLSTRARRILAVFIDTIVFFAVWTVIGLVVSTSPLLYTVLVIFVLDLALTAFFGRSAGRWVTGIRVARPDGSAPGLVPALIRTVIVFVSGWAGLLAFRWSGYVGSGSRMWWDAAAGTQIVRANQAVGSGAVVASNPTRATHPPATTGRMDIGQAIAELRSRNEPVPKPIRLPTEQEVNAAEEQLGIRFPADYRRFQLEASDVSFSTLEPFVVIPTMPYLDLIHSAQEAWRIGVPRTWLPFCENNGDYYCLDGSTVRYWSHNGTTDEHWADLGTWIVEVWIGESD